MPKISKRKAKLHLEACGILEQKTLSSEDRDFVYENWLPSYNNNTGWIAAFFTPIAMTYDFAMYTPDKGSVVDLAAGIGGLSRAMIDSNYISGNPLELEIVCVERNKEFVEVGKKLVPEARWIQADIFDQSVWEKLGHFNYAVSNPPFGQIGQAKDHWLKYNGVADLMTVSLALEIAKGSTFILPQSSLPFKYSGQSSYQMNESKNFNNLRKAFPEMGCHCSSIDTSVYQKSWLDTCPAVEIVTFENMV